MNANGWHYAEGEKTFGPTDLKEIHRSSSPKFLTHAICWFGK
jgi:hypothetical protein